MVAYARVFAHILKCTGCFQAVVISYEIVATRANLLRLVCNAVTVTRQECTLLSQLSGDSSIDAPVLRLRIQTEVVQLEVINAGLCLVERRFCWLGCFMKLNHSLRVWVYFLCACKLMRSQIVAWNAASLKI